VGGLVATAKVDDSEGEKEGDGGNNQRSASISFESLPGRNLAGEYSTARAEERDGKTYLTNPTSSLSEIALKALTLLCDSPRVMEENSTELATAFIFLFTEASDLREAESRYFAVARESSVGRVVREVGKEGWKGDDIERRAGTQRDRCFFEADEWWLEGKTSSLLFRSSFGSRGNKARREELGKRKERSVLP